MYEGEILKIHYAPLLFIDWSDLPEIPFSSKDKEYRTLNVRQRRMLRRITEDPIKHFEVEVDKGWFDVPIGMHGKFQMDTINPTLFTTEGTMYLKVIGSGFKFVDKTFNFNVYRRGITHLVFGWKFGIWDTLVRAFLSLFSSETTCKGTLTIGRFSRDFDVTKEIPVL